MPASRGSALAVALLAMTLGGTLPPLRAQDQGPIAPPPKFEVNRIPSVPHPGPPPIPVPQIIEKLAANEDVMKKAFENYTFTQTIRVEELGDPGGKFTATGEVYIRPDGSRYWRINAPPLSNTKFVHVSIEDVRAIIGFPAFSLTSDEIGDYNFLYAGQDKLDELNTYVFQVKPKMLSRSRRFFEGVIWVDDHDLAIVKTYGKFVSEFEGAANGSRLPFKMFETYRENFQGKYWLPTYTNSDDYLDQPDDAQLHLRLVIRDTDLKPVSPGAAPAPAEPSALPTAQPTTATPPKP
jgi:hypothetical protein